ncbi:MAG: YcxB family protein [Proteobacteria bacterium]|nr:YcxB family protein [Pseudomonadota bacterium]
MKVTTELKVSDIVAVNLRNYVSNRARYVMCVVIAFAYSAYLISDLGMPADQRAWFIYVAGGVLFAIAFFLLFLIVNVLNAVVIVRDTSGVVGPHDIQILPEGFRDTTPVTDSLTRWSGVHRITRRGDYLSFWVSPYLAHVVPGRAFADAAAFADFERLARTYLSGETAVPAPAPTPLPAARVVVQTDPKLWKRPA